MGNGVLKILLQRLFGNIPLNLDNTADVKVNPQQDADYILQLETGVMMPA